MTDSDRSDSELHNHNQVRVLTPEGDYETVLACEVSEDDINPDGTVSTPVSGECECVRIAPEPISTSGVGDAVPIGVLEDLIEDRMEKAELFRERGLNADYHATKEFAEELREVINDYE